MLILVIYNLLFFVWIMYSSQLGTTQTKFGLCICETVQNISINKELEGEIFISFPYIVQ